MRIAVCDDEPAQAQLLARRVQHWARERELASPRMVIAWSG